MVDAVQQPPHYTSHPSGVEMTAIAEHFGFCLGNVIKYVWRANLKGEPLEDLRKAAWYLEREIARREAAEVPPLRADFTICGLSFPSPVMGIPYVCTLDVFHDGDHATGLSVDLRRGDRLGPFNTPGHTPVNDEQIVRGQE